MGHRTVPRVWANRAVVIAVLLVAALAWWPALTTLAAEQVDAGLKRALVSFGVARTLNALLSVLQGTTVSAQPLGVGVTLSLGQVLEPVNRVVEQFSTVMLFASAAFGIERVLLAIGSWWPVSLFLGLAALAWSWRTWRNERASPWLSNLLVVLVVIRFAVPVVTLGADFLFRQFLDEHYVANVQALQEVQGKVDQAAPPDAAQVSKNWIERLKDVAVAPITDARQRYAAIRAAAEHAIEGLVQLMVIFLVQTVVLPLLLVWALASGARMLVKGAAISP